MVLTTQRIIFRINKIKILVIMIFRLNNLIDMNQNVLQIKIKNITLIIIVPGCLILQYDVLLRVLVAKV